MITTLISNATIAYVGLGSNLDGPADQVKSAIRKLKELPSSVFEKRSSLFRTKPLGTSHGGDYINAVVRIKTHLRVHTLLYFLQKIEKEHGRKRPYPNAPRTLDLDLLLYGTLRTTEKILTVPHPRIKQRAFVLVPLLQLDPLIVIPGQGTAYQLRAELTGQFIHEIME